jgi:hypothetical protein
MYRERGGEMEHEIDAKTDHRLQSWLLRIGEESRGDSETRQGNLPFEKAALVFADDYPLTDRISEHSDCLKRHFMEKCNSNVESTVDNLSCEKSIAS